MKILPIPENPLTRTDNVSTMRINGRGGSRDKTATDWGTKLGREVRRVPANWEHPKDAIGRYIPLRGGSFSERLAEWERGKAEWDKGNVLGYDGTIRPKDDDEIGMDYSDWDGKRPVASDYMPDFPESERTHFQMYEDTSEGTPISPVMETPENLARWLADHEASAFGRMTASYEAWLATIRRGYSLGMVASSETGIISGVEYAGILGRESAK